MNRRLAASVLWGLVTWNGLSLAAFAVSAPIDGWVTILGGVATSIGVWRFAKPGGSSNNQPDATLGRLETTRA